MSALKWLEGKVPAFKALGDDAQREIMEFSLLWGFFEFSLLDKSATAEKISQLCDQLDADKRIDAARFEDAVAYWRDRYYINGDFTDDFHSLFFRNNDNEEAVRTVLAGRDESPKALLLFALLIVWRFRNNLFHGTKWTYTLKDQYKNFQMANTSLMVTMDMAGVRLET